MAGDLASLITGTEAEREGRKEERSSGRKNETDLDGWSPRRHSRRPYPSDRLWMLGRLQVYQLAGCWCRVWPGLYQKEP